jgi:pimeloyl-ACP methyl ester carboxylesterase
MAKTPLILLPGLLCDQRLWQHQIKVLGAIAEVLVPDLTKFSSIEDMAIDVLRRAPPEFALAGLSMGGYVAFEVLRQKPKRVLKLALLDTSARPDTPEQRERRTGLIALSKTGKFKGVTPRLLPLLVHPDHQSRKDIIDPIFAMAEDMGKDGFERQQTAILNRVDSRPTLKTIKCKTLVIGGKQDAITPPEILQEIAAKIGNNAAIHIIDKSGHLAPLEQPQTVNKLMWDWLSA